MWARAIVVVGGTVLAACGGASSSGAGKPRIVSSRVIANSATTSGEVTSTKQGATIELRQKQMCEVVRETPFASGGWIRRKLRRPCKQAPLAGAALVLQVGQSEIPLGKTDARGVLSIRWHDLRPKLGDATTRFAAVVIADTSQKVGTLGIAPATAEKRPPDKQPPPMKPKPAPKPDRAAITAQVNTAVKLAAALRPGFASAVLNAKHALSRVPAAESWTRTLVKQLDSARVRAARRAVARGRRLRRRRKLHAAFVMLSSASALAPGLRGAKRELAKLTPRLRRPTVGFVTANFDAKRVTIATYMPRHHRRALRMFYSCDNGGGFSPLRLSRGFQLQKVRLDDRGRAERCRVSVGFADRRKGNKALFVGCAVRNQPLRPGECK